MICANCGEGLPDDAKFCLQCGAATPNHRPPTTKAQGREALITYGLLLLALAGLIWLVWKARGSG